MRDSLPGFLQFAVQDVYDVIKTFCCHLRFLKRWVSALSLIKNLFNLKVYKVQCLSQQSPCTLEIPLVIKDFERTLSPLIMDQAVGTHSYRREYMYTVQWVESVYTACKVIKIGHNVHLTSCSKLG